MSACVALIQACAAEARAGRIAEPDGERIVATTGRDLFTDPGPGQA